MTKVDTPSMSEAVPNRVETFPVDDRLLSVTEHDSNRTAWQQLIDRKLIEWGKDPTVLEDDGVVAPSTKAIHLACDVAQFMRDVGAPAAIRVVPDGDGGISFERRTGLLSQSIEIDRDGMVELIAIVDSRLVYRQRLH